jgi:hypothetical protein
LVISGHPYEEGFFVVNLEFIRPSFMLANDSAQMGESIIAFVCYGHNKELGAALVDEKAGIEAFLHCLSEYKNSLDTTSLRQKKSSAYYGVALG